jgi:hypothetical protein
VTGYGLEGRVLVGARFSPLHVVQTRPEAHPGSNKYQGPFPQG